MIIGHSVSNVEGVIQAIDEPVAAILQRTQRQLVGISYTAITHAADLARNLSHVAALIPNSGAVRIRKRYIGGEGGVIMLDVEVSRLGGSGSGYLVGTLSTIDASTRPTDPALASLDCADPNYSSANQSPQRLWRRAKDLLKIARARDTLLGADLFADHAWTMLLLIYVAEAESRIATIPMVVDYLHLSRLVVERWIRVLHSKLLLEPVSPGADALQLTQIGIDRVERLLAEQAVAAAY